MKLNNLGSNQTEVEIGTGTIFFSYNTPVAANIDGKFYRTDKHWSVTTSKHINRWLDGRTAEKMPQSYFDTLSDDQNSAQ